MEICNTGTSRTVEGGRWGCSNIYLFELMNSLNGCFWHGTFYPNPEIRLQLGRTQFTSIFILWFSHYHFLFILPLFGYTFRVACCTDYIFSNLVISPSQKRSNSQIEVERSQRKISSKQFSIKKMRADSPSRIILPFCKSHSFVH